MRVLALLLPVFLLSSGVARGDEFTNVGKRMAVDLLLVRGEGELRGLVVSQSRDRVAFAVRRDWMQARHPGWLGRLDAELEKGREERDSLLATRLDEWMATLRRDADRNRQLLATIGIIQDDAKAREEKQDQKPSRFVLVTVPVADVRRVIAQPAEKRQLACVAWEEELTAVEETPAIKLQQTLDKQDKTWPSRTTKILAELPGGEEGDESWSARTAVWEFQFADRVTFQGTGGAVFRTDRSDQQPSLAQVVPAILQGSALSDLSGLLDGRLDGPRPAAASGDAARKAAIVQAEKAGAGGSIRGFRLTVVNMLLERNSVEVSSEFLVRLPDGTWGTIWRESAVENSAAERKEAEDRIRQDPQLAEALKLTAALGVQGEIEKAIRAGAATMAAQQTVDARFNKWVEGMTQRFDGPALTVQRGEVANSRVR